VSYGALVALLVIAAAPVAYVLGRDGLAALGEADATTAIVRGGLAVAAALVPIVALAVYTHWLDVTTRERDRRETHVPTVAEDWFLGALVAVIIFAGWPVVTFAYRETRQAFDALELAAAVGYGLLGCAYIAFVLLCVKRYIDWLRL